MKALRLAETGKLEALREACALVAMQASHVTINTAKIPAYARFIIDAYPVITGMDEPHHFVSDDDEETAAYILALDSINFGSGYFAATGLEYDKIAGALKNAFLRDEMNTAEKWMAATFEDCCRIFLDAPRTPLAEELMRNFCKHLNETGRMISGRYQGKVLNLFRAANNSVARLVDIVSEWSGFYDVSEYKGTPVPFLKRAQILPAHTFLTLKGRGGTGFTDMHALTIFADNMVPHVLRHDGILTYAPALAEKIDSGVMLESGSEEETEIRACAIHAVELMTASVQGFTAVNFDHILWNRGNEPEIYKHPPHRTRTVWY